MHRARTTGDGQRGVLSYRLRQPSGVGGSGGLTGYLCKAEPFLIFLRSSCLWLTVLALGSPEQENQTERQLIGLEALLSCLYIGHFYFCGF